MNADRTFHVLPLLKAEYARDSCSSWEDIALQLMGRHEKALCLELALAQAGMKYILVLSGQ